MRSLRAISWLLRKVNDTTSLLHTQSSFPIIKKPRIEMMTPNNAFFFFWLHNPKSPDLVVL